MGQYANSTYSDQGTQSPKHVQQTVAQQLDGAIKPKNLGTFVIPQAKIKSSYGGWSASPAIVDTRVGPEIRKVMTESSELDAFGVDNVRRLRQMGFSPEQILEYIRAQTFNAGNIQQTIGTNYRETISEKPLIAETEAGYTANLSKQTTQSVEEIEKPREEERKIKNFSQWNINHIIHVIQRSNKTDTLIEIKPATPEEITDKKASKILRPFISTKRNDVKVKAAENNLQPITPIATDNTSRVTHDEVIEHSQSTQDIPHTPTDNEETLPLDTQTQSEDEAIPTETQEEVTKASKPTYTNPFTKLTGVTSEGAEQVPSEVLPTESVEQEDEDPVPTVNVAAPNFMSRLAGEYAPLEIPKSAEVEAPIESHPVNTSEKLMKRTEVTTKLLHTMEIYYGGDWSKYMRVEEGRDDRINKPPVKGLETVKMRSWQDNLSEKATELKNKIQ